MDSLAEKRQLELSQFTDSTDISTTEYELPVTEISQLVQILWSMTQGFEGRLTKLCCLLLYFYWLDQKREIHSSRETNIAKLGKNYACSLLSSLVFLKISTHRCFTTSLDEYSLWMRTSFHQRRYSQPIDHGAINFLAYR